MFFHTFTYVNLQNIVLQIPKPTETMKFYFERNVPILNSNMHIIKIQYWGVLSRVSLLFITHEKNLWNSSFSVNKFYRLWYNFIISRNGKVLIDIIVFEHEVLWLLDDYGKISYCLTPQVPSIYLHRNHAFSTQTRHILAFYDRTTLLLRSLFEAVGGMNHIQMYYLYNDFPNWNITLRYLFQDTQQGSSCEHLQQHDQQRL